MDKISFACNSLLTLYDFQLYKLSTLYTFKLYSGHPYGILCFGSVYFLPKGCPYRTKSISQTIRFYLFLTFNF